MSLSLYYHILFSHFTFHLVILYGTFLSACVTMNSAMY